MRDGMPGTGDGIVIGRERAGWVRGAGHDGDSGGEGAVERPEEELSAVRSGKDPFLGGEERVVGWVGWVRYGETTHFVLDSEVIVRL